MEPKTDLREYVIRILSKFLNIFKPRISLLYVPEDPDLQHRHNKSIYSTLLNPLYITASSSQFVAKLPDHLHFWRSKWKGVTTQ